MFKATHEILSENTHQYKITCDGVPVPYADVLERWQQDADFRSFFIDLLVNSTFPVYRWETPAITHQTANRPFEFVLIHSPGLECQPDRHTFSAHFTGKEVNEGIVSLENLGKDALLIIPSPRASDSVYTHLASFIRQATESQKHALWKSVGRHMQKQLADSPRWLSTAGGGVAWLHVRIDVRPKYYHHAPYRKFD